MSNLVIVDHPLVTHKISMIRDKNTNTRDFRTLVSEIAMLIGYEATRDLPLYPKRFSTPLMEAEFKMLSSMDVAVVPILRAGLGMVDGILSLLPTAKVGHIGLYRDHDTLEPVEYYCKLPSDLDLRQVFVLDPMLATGGSASAAINFIKQRGAKKIKLLCIVAAPLGVERITKDHPDVTIYCGALDERLNDKGYILPGLGDAGDRLFGTQ
ncbi:MAG: uracil phosphoribosyltransferase [Clostridiaceae bacterium]|nr:uracil phosphoribosyltransferase [Clostridiaceae bacterium]